jgi:hypothetical protein
VHFLPPYTVMGWNCTAFVLVGLRAAKHTVQCTHIFQHLKR